ncbi:hypothetical protein HDV05_004174 [Chytridiales sp. JEL 0842]|nr:hypothetical protein HDV05_004174 [Chytridiales sp. JEL 0842]
MPSTVTKSITAIAVKASTVSYLLTNRKSNPAATTDGERKPQAVPKSKRLFRYKLTEACNRSLAKLASLLTLANDATDASKSDETVNVELANVPETNNTFGFNESPTEPTSSKSSRQSKLFKKLRKETQAFFARQVMKTTRKGDDTNNTMAPKPVSMFGFAEKTRIWIKSSMRLSKAGVSEGLELTESAVVA